MLQVSHPLILPPPHIPLQIPPQTLPILQKHLITKSNKLPKPVITPTQILHSIQPNPPPTPPQPTHLPNPIYDPTHPLILSSQTPPAQYPQQAL
ncbi:pyruvate kinase, partial [Staphylococcus epidermidis]|uniref:pyruvate kinase n=1 Tax=Staphylococcus epidermidis TaxID=1282 RepID=UPI0037DA7962